MNKFRKLIREEIKKVLKEYVTNSVTFDVTPESTNTYDPYYTVHTIKKSDLPKELQYHGDMQCVKGHMIDAYFSEAEQACYVSTPKAHRFHAFNCANVEELKAIVMKYDKTRADAEDDLFDKSKTHVITKEN